MDKKKAGVLFQFLVFCSLWEVWKFWFVHRIKGEKWWILAQFEWRVWVHFKLIRDLKFIFSVVGHWRLYFVTVSKKENCIWQFTTSESNSFNLEICYPIQREIMSQNINRNLRNISETTEPKPVCKNNVIFCSRLKEALNKFVFIMIYF